MYQAHLIFIFYILVLSRNEIYEQTLNCKSLIHEFEHSFSIFHRNGSWPGCQGMQISIKSIIQIIKEGCFEATKIRIKIELRNLDELQNQ